MSKYEIRKLDEKGIQHLRESWIPEAEANDELPVSSYVKAVSWAGEVVSGSANTEAEVHGVVCEQGEIHAIFDRVAVRPDAPRGYFKIISMVVSPSLDLSAASPESFYSIREQFAAVVAEVIVHGIKLLGEHEKAEKVKFYASDRVTLSLFQKVWGSFDSQILDELNLQTNAYGNWAEFSKNW